MDYPKDPQTFWTTLSQPYVYIVLMEKKPHTNGVTVIVLTLV